MYHYSREVQSPLVPETPLSQLFGNVSSVDAIPAETSDATDRDGSWTHSEELARDVRSHIDNNLAQEHGVEQRWGSFWLRTTTLLALAALFAAMSASLVVLWLTDKAQNGFGTSLSSNRYLWTYGPTAAIMVVVSLWRQIDYYCKIMQPWQQLESGPVEAEDSVLLDYVSPIFVTSLVKAMQRRHYAVAICITGFVLLKIITIFSTGLLVLTPTSLERDSPVTLATKFEGDNCRPASSVEIELPESLVSTHPKYQTSSRAAFIHRAIMNRTRSLPVGTSDDAVFQWFRMPHGQDIRSTSTEVDVFKINVSCEVADVTMRPDTSIPAWYDKGSNLNHFQLSTPSCLLGSGSDEMWFGAAECRRRCDLSAVRVDVTRVNCSSLIGASEDDNKATAGAQFLLRPDSPWDIRYATLVANVTYEDNDLVDRIFGKVQSMAAVICKTEYSMGRGKAILDQNAEISIAEDFRPFGLLSNISAAALGEIIWSTIFAASQDAMERPPVEDFYADLLLEGLQGNRSLQALLSASNLQLAATKLLSGVAIQYIQDQCIKSTDSSGTGKVRYDELRLHVAPLSLWFMIAGFLLLSLCTVGVLRTVRQTAGRQNPAFIVTKAMSVGGSKRMNRLLRCSGCLRTSGLSFLLRGYEFQAFGDSCIQVISSSSHNFALSDTVIDTKPPLWVPLAARRYMVALTMILPLVFIAVLEVTHHVSAANQGILDVSGHEERATSVSGYVSALIMLMIATCFNALDFTILSLAPYNLLRCGRGTGTTALKLDLLGQLPPVAIAQSLRRRQFGPALSSLTGLLGPFLTIISSGLWITASVSNSVPIEAFSAHYWNISWYNSSTQGDGGAGLMLNDIQHGSSTLPPTISDSLVLPEISRVRRMEAISLTNSSMIAEARYHLDLNALQAMLVCDVVSDNEIVINIPGHESGSKDRANQEPVSITATPQLPQSCWRGGPNGNNPFYNFTASVPLRETGMLAILVDLHLGPWESWQLSPGSPLEREWGEFHTLDQIQDNPAGCPSIGVLYGPYDNKNYSPVPEDYTVFLCSQKVAQIPVQVAFFENLTIDTNRPLIRRTGPIRYLNNGTAGIETFPYRPERYLGGNSERYYQNLTLFRETGSPVESLFFNHLIYGPNGTNSPEKLAGKANRPELIERVQSLYSRYMALVIDAKFRAPLSDEESVKSPIHGTVSVNSSRLQINATSKTTLQIFLACMVVFGFAAYLMTDLRTTLPRKPTSIASVMSLLAGSDLCGDSRSFLPEGAENMTSEELDKHLDGLIVRLGWWSQNADGPSSSSDGDSREENKNEGLVVNSEEIRRRRFGIDIGKPEQLGFRPESTLRQKIGALRRRKAPAAQESTGSQG